MWKSLIFDIGSVDWQPKNIVSFLWDKNPAVLVSWSMTAGYRQAAGLSHWLAWLSPSSHWQMLFPSLNVSQTALASFWFDYKFSEGRNFHIGGCHFESQILKHIMPKQSCYYADGYWFWWTIIANKTFCFLFLMLPLLQIMTTAKCLPNTVVNLNQSIVAEKPWIDDKSRAGSVGPVGCQEACLHCESSQQSPNPGAMGVRVSEREGRVLEYWI